MHFFGSTAVKENILLLLLGAASSAFESPRRRWASKDLENVTCKTNAAEAKGTCALGCPQIDQNIPTLKP